MPYLPIGPSADAADAANGDDAPTIEGFVNQHPNSGSDLFDRLVGREQAGAERRHQVRHPMTMVIVGAPLNASGSPTDVAVGLTLIDLSLTGAGLLAFGEMTAPLLLLDFGGADLPGVQLIASVRWRREGRTSVKLGCEFLQSFDGPVPLK